MIVDSISYIPRHAWSPAMAPAPPTHRNHPAISRPGASGQDEDGDLPPTAISAPISPQTWPRIFPGL